MNMDEISAPTAEEEITYIDGVDEPPQSRLSPMTTSQCSSYQTDSGRASSASTLKSPEKDGQPKRLGKMVVCRVALLDGTTFEPKRVDKNATGQAVFQQVCQQMDLAETDYFGLTYRDTSGKKFWLDHSKKISKQVKGGTWVFEFQVKFYPPDPSALKEEITRYQLVLQLRVDIFNGKLPCSFVTYALLGSYTVQAEIGDYDPIEHGKTSDYLRDFDFAPASIQNQELFDRVAELHRQHKGQTRPEADLNFLDNAKRLAMYGVDLHDAVDSDNKDIVLGVCATGILVYKEKLRINRFVWPKILKLSYKRTSFYVKIRPGEFEPHEKTIGFKLGSHKMAKRLWKTCVEHHAFFRLKESEPPRQSTLFPRFNSKFRYSGRTQAQARKHAEAINREEPHIQRTAERRSLSHPDKAKSMDDMAHRQNQLDNEYPDENDRRDKMGVPTAIAGLEKRPGDDRYLNEDGRHRRPGEEGGDAADRLDKTPGDEDKTAVGYAGDAAGVLEGGVVGKKDKDKSKKDKEREKREKEEEKRRKKEEEEERKRQEKERKRLEKLEKENKKKGGKVDQSDAPTTEDITDKMGGKDATETVINGVQPGSAELETEEQRLARLAAEPGEGESPQKGKGKDKKGDKGAGGGGLFGKLKKSPSKAKDQKSKVNEKDADKAKVEGAPPSPTDGATQKEKKRKRSGSSSSSSSSSDEESSRKKAAALAGSAGVPAGRAPGTGAKYGVGVDFVPGDFGMAPGDDKSIDRKMQFIPIVPPTTVEGRDRNKSATSVDEEPMPFFTPAGVEGEGSFPRKVPPPVPPKSQRNGYDSEEDRLRREGPPTVATESFKYNPDTDETRVSTTNVPIVKTETRTVTYEKDGVPVETEDGILVSAQSHSTRTQTIETTTFKTEKDGMVETHVQRKVTVSTDGDEDLDHDELLAAAIRQVTEMNPNLSVERIECMRQIEEVSGDK